MVIETLLTQIAAQGFGGLLANLATNYVNRKDRKISTNEETIKRDLTEHLKITFSKCMKVKTILNNDMPSETLQIYVDQRFSVRGQDLDQFSMVDHIRSGNSTVIIGAGGGGKSMFMRYLWLSFFEKSDGKIPFFLELRNLNGVTHSKLNDFIFHSIVKSGSKIRQSEFDNALRSGEFIIFFDGFDEVNFDRRETVQQWILELQDDNPAITVVVTSRSDERFLGWENFTITHVKSLTEESAKLLIERADYDNELKDKFLLKFDTLWELHHDFLSNPLLAYMMLVSFSYNPDIPKRMFQFYEQAFEALYHRHDLTKGYKRKFHCELDKIDFIRLTSYFCLKTYYEEKVEFTQSEILESIEKSKSIELLDVSSEKFLNDLTQSVCILKLEGLTYTFTHRSFQEYFSAYCIARVGVRKIEKLFSRFAKNYSDSVLPMVADINADLFREKFVIGNARKFKSFFERKTKTKLYESFASRVGARFEIVPIRAGKSGSDKFTRDSGGIHLILDGEMTEFYRVIWTIAENQGRAIEVIDGNDHNFRKFLTEKFLRKGETLYIFVENNVLRFSTSKELDGNRLSPKDEKEIRAEFETTKMYSFINNRALTVLNFTREEVAAYKQVTGAFSDLF